MKLINKLYITIASIAVMSMTTSCEDFLTTAPSTDLTDTQIIKDVSGLNMLLQGTYRQMRDGDGTPNFYSPEGIKAVSTVTGGDMMINDEQVGDLWYFSIFSPQRYVSSASIPCDMWYKMYRIIGNANIIITSADGAAGSEELKGEIKGQALALRARCYFNLIRFYQHTYAIAKNKPGVPLLLEPTVDSKKRASVEEVYSQIVSDLTNASSLLNHYERPDKQYYNKDVVNFLLAQVYLTMENWVEAGKCANAVRTSYDLMTMNEYKAGFSTINREWVLGYIQTSQDYWWYDSPACWYDFGQTNAPWRAELFLPNNYFVEEVMKDDPRALFVNNPKYSGRYAASKFLELKDEGPYGDLYDFRAAEMYLTEAEAKARQEDVALTDAVIPLNFLREARGLAKLDVSGKSRLNVIDAILLERRKEMWGEGLDYFDIMRLQKPVVKTMAQGHYEEVNIPALSNKLIMMIPEKEVVNNKEIEQNPNPTTDPIFKP